MRVAVLLALATSACTWDATPPEPSPAERGRDLVVTDDDTLASLSKNASGDPLSFRRAIERVAPGGALPWMRAWAQRLRDEGAPARADLLDGVTCAWLRSAPDSGCTDDCTTCAATDLPLDRAPFRLVAVVNRTDLADMPDRAADGGEGRLVFGLTDGPADNGAPARAMTVAFEYAQPGAARDWAERWHDLAALDAADFPAALVKLASWVDAGTLAQLRTADAVTGPLVLHEFHRASGALVPAAVRNTPDWTRVSEADLRAFCDADGDAIAAGTHVLPAAWLARSASLDDAPPAYVAGLPDHDALLANTCGGCHAKTDDGFQLDPRARGDAKLSRFLVDPSGAPDEVGRRAAWAAQTLSGK